MKRHVPVTGHRGVYWSESKTGKRYSIAFRDVTGKRHFKVVGPNLQEALTYQAETKVKLSKNVKAHYAPVTFGAVSEEWKQATYPHLATNTQRAYENALDNFLLPVFENRKIITVTTDQVAGFILGLRTASGSPMSGSYAQIIYIVLHSVMEYAANDRRGYIPKNPCASLERGERPRKEDSKARALTEPEANRIFSASPRWFRPILMTGLYSGLRAGEILGLRWDDIAFEENILHVRHQLLKGSYQPTKGRDTRDVPLLPPLRKILYALPTRFVGAHLFNGANGVKVQYGPLQKAFQEARDKAGVAGVTMHSTRHTYASALLRNGEDVVRVSEYLGHKDTAVTLRVYAHFMKRDDNWSETATRRISEAIGDLG
jgi:integrase